MARNRLLEICGQHEVLISYYWIFICLGVFKLKVFKERLHILVDVGTAIQHEIDIIK